MRYAMKLLNENPIAVRLYGDGRESMKVFSRSLYVPIKFAGCVAGSCQAERTLTTTTIQG